MPGASICPGSGLKDAPPQSLRQELCCTKEKSCGSGFQAGVAESADFGFILDQFCTERAFFHVLFRELFLIFVVENQHINCHDEVQAYPCRKGIKNGNHIDSKNEKNSRASNNHLSHVHVSQAWKDKIQPDGKPKAFFFYRFSFFGFIIFGFGYGLFFWFLRFF